MFRPALLSAGIAALLLAAAPVLPARPGETLEQITARLGSPIDLTPDHAKWVFPDRTILYVTLVQTGEQRVSTQECLIHFREKDVFPESTIAGFLRYESGPRVGWVLAVAMPEVPQPFVYVDDNRASTRFSTDGELAAFLVPLDHPQAIVVRPLPENLKAEATIRIGDARASAERAAARERARARPAAPPAAPAVAVTPAAEAAPAPASTAGAPAAAPPPPAAPAAPWAWPEVASDLTPDPQVTSGRLPNGLRYVILPNAEPKGRVSMRLLVAAGSLQERDDERGLAHFVEHMVFRGTRSHPGATLANDLERAGLGMGPDNTAFTTPDHTIYHLELPNGGDALLRQCFRTLREYAEEVAFAPDLVEKERGVVLSELATRTKSDFLARCVNTEFLFPGSRYANRFPIGLPATIRTCTRDQLVAFYNAWYRPGRLAVIVVGDVPPGKAEGLIQEIFGPLAGRGPPRDDPSDVMPPTASKSNIYVYSDPSQSGVAYLFEHPVPFPSQPDTLPRRVENLQQALAFSMFQTRLDKYSRQFPGSFVAPHAFADYSIPGWQVAELAAIGRMTDWQDMAIALEQEHRRARERGFDDDELKIAKANFANALNEAVHTVATRPSNWLANRLADCVLYGRVFARPEVIRDDQGPALAAITAADCSRAFRQAWGDEPAHVFVITHPVFPFKGDAIANVLSRSRAQATQNLTQPVATPFAYVDFGPPGTLVRDELVADLGVHLAGFANGVRLNFKQTAFVADWVEVCLRLGTGKRSQPPTRPGYDLFAGAALTAGGLRKHSQADLADVLAGRSLQVRFDVDTDAFVFTGQCARRDLPVTLQLITAFITDAAYRPEALDEVRARFSSMYASMTESPGWPITTQAPRILAGGDRRFGMPDLDDLCSGDMTSLSNWLEPQFKADPIEMSIVGDVSWDEANAAVARTLGALPARQPRPTAAPGAEVRCAAPAPVPNAFFTPPAVRQVALAWAWPVSDLKDIHQDRRCRLLAAVVADRFTFRLREQLGATYSTGAAFHTHDGFPAFNYFLAYAEVLPAQAKDATQLMVEEIARLRDQPLTADEFARIKQPFLRALDDESRTNRYWGVTVLSEAQEHPEKLAAARDRSADYASIRPAEITALAKRCFGPTQTFFFITWPVSSQP